MFVWSNIYPTQIKINGKVYTPNDNEVVLFHNAIAQHRADPEYIEAVRAGVKPNRYFARAYMENEPTSGDIQRWKKFLETEVNSDS
jgi:predicted NAD-dependent protein-ADP-ribosyltransferase YbiA (DUF1768 family)